METEPVINGEEMPDETLPVAEVPEEEPNSADADLDDALAELVTELEVAPSVIEAVDAPAEGEAAASDVAAPAEPDTDTAAEPVADTAADTAPAEPVPAPAEAPAGDTASAEQPVVAAGFRSGQSLAWWPFLAYVGLWLAFCGVTVWQLLELPAETSAYESSLYPLIVFGGLTLTAMGPLLLVFVWLFGRRNGASRGATLTTALVRGAAATMLGVIMWWAALISVDAVRLGRLF